MKKTLFLSLFSLGLALAGSWYYLANSYAKRICPIGHLTPESICEMDSSILRPLGLGWDYSLAKGLIDKKFCPLRGGEQDLGPLHANFTSSPCDEFLENLKGDCLSARQGSLFVVLASDAKCEEGVYFEGHGRMIHAGQVIPLRK